MKGEKEKWICPRFNSQISILVAYPHLYLTFSEGNIGAPRSSDPANERYCLSRAKNHFKNIGCGGTTGLNLPLNRHTDIIILVVIRILLGITLFGKPSDYLMNVMQLRCEETYHCVELRDDSQNRVSSTQSHDINRKKKYQ